MILLIILGALLLLVMLFLWPCLRISSECSRMEEEYGLGYLIVYGSQVFNMDLVMATVLVLAVAAVVMYQLVLWLEKFFKNRLGVTQ